MQHKKNAFFKDMGSNRVNLQPLQAPNPVVHSNQYTLAASGVGSRQMQRQGTRGHVPEQNTNNAFAKPRALSRQADGNIKIEVHRDVKIRDYLNAEKQENMNLMFYDFNGSSIQQKTA